MSTLRLACARWQETWDDITIASSSTAARRRVACGCHTGTRALSGVTRHRPKRTRFLFLAKPTHRRVARALLTAVTPTTRSRFRSLPGCNCRTKRSRPDCRLTSTSEFAQPNVMLVTRNDREQLATFGFDDLDFVQRSPDKGLITKQARAVSLAKLALRDDDTVWDIGAGAGSVGLEAARLVPHGHVWAIEKNADDAAASNALRATNYTLVDGRTRSRPMAGPECRIHRWFRQQAMR